MPFDLIVPRRPGRFSKEFARFLNEHSAEDPVKNRKTCLGLEKWFINEGEMAWNKADSTDKKYHLFRRICPISGKCALVPRIGSYECQNLPDFGQMSGLARSIFAQHRSNVRL